MKAIVLGLALMLGAVMAAQAQGEYGGAPPPNPAADAFLYSIYARYTGAPEQTKPIDYSKEAELRKYFTADLVAIIMKDRAQADAKGEVPLLDGDPFVGAQEWNIQSFDISVRDESATGAVGIVKFQNYGKAVTVEVMLVRESGAWRIAEIDWGPEAGSLRGIFEDRD
jgi:hypothetical protein